MAQSPTFRGAGKSDSVIIVSSIINLMGITILAVIAVLLLVYLFATMIYPEKF